MTQEKEGQETQDHEQADEVREEPLPEPAETASGEVSEDQRGDTAPEPSPGSSEPESDITEADPAAPDLPDADEAAEPASAVVADDEAAGETEEAATEKPEGAQPEQPMADEPQAAAEEPPVPQPDEGTGVAEITERGARATEKKVASVATLPDDESAERKWYVIHAHSGHENKVKQSLENRVTQEHLEDLVNQVLIPSEEVAEVKGGKKRITSRKIYPGYVLVEMKLTHKTWHLIRTTAGVTGFIGSGKMPTPLEPEEVESIFEQMRGEQKKPKPKVSFEKDEKVKIIEGPFTNFLGYVDEINPERGKLKVMVEIFERLTSVELEFWQVEKI